MSKSNIVYEAKGLFTLSESDTKGKGPFTLVILLSLETVESLQIGVVTHFQVTPLFSMKAVFLASSQS